MKILILCKASSKIGLGHLIRSKTLAYDLVKKSASIKMIVIGENVVDRLVQDIPFEVDVIPSEDKLILNDTYDVIFYDMLNLSDSVFTKIKNQSKMDVSLSPIFDQMENMDLFFNRSKYFHLPYDNPPKTYAGLEYSLISNHCIKIPTSIYEYNLEQNNFPIAISMGGGDAANKTLQVLESIKHCKVPATFWVMLGEGYSHSYSELINVIKKDTNHEIILAKANQSMWQVLKNCILAILPGGITTYEAAFAGLPTINLLEETNKKYLIQELTENGVSSMLNGFDRETMVDLNNKIEYYFNNKKELMQMHINSKNLIDNKGGARIYDDCVDCLYGLCNV